MANQSVLAKLQASVKMVPSDQSICTVAARELFTVSLNVSGDFNSGTDTINCVACTRVSLTVSSMGVDTTPPKLADMFEVPALFPQNCCSFLTPTTVVLLEVKLAWEVTHSCVPSLSVTCARPLVRWRCSVQPSLLSTSGKPEVSGRAPTNRVSS